MAAIGYALQGMQITAMREDVLKKLKENREEHKKIVTEARIGYVKKAEEVLQKRLGQLREGKIVSLAFSLTVPKDMTEAYDSAISALEWHTGEKITLTAAQVRMFIEDAWDWMDDFLVSNSRYSSSAAVKAAALAAAASDE
jgi:hypothetical protein